MFGAAPISVLVVDDVALIRERIAELVEGDGRLELAGEASDGREALRKIREVQPDVVILDVFVPEMSGAESLAALRRDEEIDINVLILTGTPDLRASLALALRETLRLRPGLVLYKNSVGDEAICDETVAVVSNPEHSPDPDLLHQAIEPTDDRIEVSKEELEMLSLLAAGFKVKELPPHVHSSPRAIENKLGRLRAKLGAKNNPAAVAKGYELGLLPRKGG